MYIYQKRLMIQFNTYYNLPYVLILVSMSYLSYRFIYRRTHRLNRNKIDIWGSNKYFYTNNLYTPRMIKMIQFPNASYIFAAPSVQPSAPFGLIFITPYDPKWRSTTEWLQKSRCMNPGLGTHSHHNIETAANSYWRYGLRSSIKT